MSDERNEATGQFTPSTDGLYGREAAEVEAGFKPKRIRNIWGK